MRFLYQYSGDGKSSDPTLHLDVSRKLCSSSFLVYHPGSRYYASRLETKRCQDKNSVCVVTVYCTLQTHIQTNTQTRTSWARSSFPDACFRTMRSFETLSFSSVATNLHDCLHSGLTGRLLFGTGMHRAAAFSKKASNFNPSTRPLHKKLHFEPSKCLFCVFVKLGAEIRSSFPV